MFALISFHGVKKGCRPLRRWTGAAETSRCRMASTEDKSLRGPGRRLDRSGQPFARFPGDNTRKRRAILGLQHRRFNAVSEFFQRLDFAFTFEFTLVEIRGLIADQLDCHIDRDIGNFITFKPMFSIHTHNISSDVNLGSSVGFDRLLEGHTFASSASASDRLLIPTLIPPWISSQ